VSTRAKDSPAALLARRSGIARRKLGACPACGSERRRLLWDVQEHEYDNTTDDRFPMQECLDCASWYLDPRPDESELGVIYPPNYYAYASASGAGTGLSEGVAARLFRSRFEAVERNATLNARTRWLEIGCGQGDVLEGLRKYYGLESFVGLDYSESAVALCRAKGFDARTLRLEDLSPADFQPFDIVHSAHVIEHVASPLVYMQKAFELLAPGGLCVFATPNTQTWESRFFGRHWGGLHVPRHWALLNPRSVSMLGERTGFELVEIVWSRSGVFWTWTFHSLLSAAFGRRVADVLFPSDHRINDTGKINVLRTAFGAVLDMLNARVLGRSSTMVAVLRKPPQQP
jgi:SAM-dependent methyltransferase